VKTCGVTKNMCEGTTKNKNKTTMAENKSEENVKPAKNKASPSPSSSSLVLWSFVWLALCCGLVHKHGELMLVFTAFCASFGAAAVLSVMLRPERQQPLHRRNHNRRVKAVTGIGACVLALFTLFFGSDAEEPKDSAEFAALSIATGYLAFDHWFSALYCQPPPDKRFLGVLEDAATLSGFLAVLVAAAAAAASSPDGDGGAAGLLSSAVPRRTPVAAWMAYRIVRFFRAAAGPSLSEDPGKEKDVPRINGATAATQSSSDDNGTWIIHGARYDLSAYVQLHPGGKEAILLGKGRDCTALFESYHPFTKDKVRRVLENYRVKGDDKPLGRLVEDPFYDVMCDRVAKTLRDSGLDPVADRAATWRRTIYYCVVILALITCAVAHCRVSTGRRSENIPCPKGALLT
jgi:hypothetical protein